MNTKLLLLFLFLSVSLSKSFSQQDVVIPDFSIESSDFSIGEDYTSIASVLSKTGEKLSWTQHYGGNTSLTEFSILSTVGNWDVSTATGTVTITIDNSGSNDTLFLSSDGNTTILKFTLYGSNTTPEVLVFNVSSIVFQ